MCFSRIFDIFRQVIHQCLHPSRKIRHFFYNLKNNRIRYTLDLCFRYFLFFCTLRKSDFLHFSCRKFGNICGFSLHGNFFCYLSHHFFCKFFSSTCYHFDVTDNHQDGSQGKKHQIFCSSYFFRSSFIHHFNTIFEW